MTIISIFFRHSGLECIRKMCELFESIAYGGFTEYLGLVKNLMNFQWLICTSDTSGKKISSNLSNNDMYNDDPGDVVQQEQKKK